MSALQDALAEDPQDFDPDPGPAEDGLDLEGSLEVIKLAYCPLIARMCGTIDCAPCSALLSNLEDTMPEHTWLCSSCSREAAHVDSYWTDGNCGGCGRYSAVLVLAEM